MIAFVLRGSLASEVRHEALQRLVLSTPFVITVHTRDTLPNLWKSSFDLLKSGIVWCMGFEEAIEVRFQAIVRRKSKNQI